MPLKILLTNDDDYAAPGGHNSTAEPFVWAKPADIIFGKLARLPAPSV